MLAQAKSQLKKFQKFTNENPYAFLMRLDKPVGALLVMLPAWWAIAFGAANIYQTLLFFFIFGIGAVLMRSSGCIINDIIDRDIDKKVKRTMGRPLASGKLKVRDALKLLAGLLVAALIILMFLPKTVIIIGLFSIIPIMIYPLMKRVTNYAQLFLGLTFNIGALMGWFAVHPGASYNPFLIYVAAILWTVGYDTIYAHQDKEDDKKIGLKSTALKLGEKTPEAVWKLYQALAVVLVIVGLNTHMNVFFYLIMAVAAYHLYWQTETVDINDPENCAEKFKSNVQFGFIVLAAILIGKIKLGWFGF